MEREAVLDGLCLDLFSFYEDCRAAPEVNVGRCQIAEAFVISAMAVVLDEDGDCRLDFTLRAVRHLVGNLLQDLPSGAACSYS